MEQIFQIEKVGKSGVKFEEKKLEFLNKMHIMNKFTYFEDEKEKQQCLTEWRQVLIETLPKNLHSKIRKTSDAKMLLIMDTMKQRIHFFKDLNNHTYFFEEPVYDNPQAKKFLTKLTQSNEVKI